MRGSRPACIIYACGDLSVLYILTHQMNAKARVGMMNKENKKFLVGMMRRHFAFIFWWVPIDPAVLEMEEEYVFYRDWAISVSALVLCHILIGPVDVSPWIKLVILLPIWSLFLFWLKGWRDFIKRKKRASE